MRDLDALMQDKLETHCRQQLSAMLDGTLAPDQARFLLRRLQHDHELAGCWERWQVYGDLMRGSVPTLLPADFSQRVQAALAGDGQAQVALANAQGPRARWAGWAGGAALAASVAVAALLVGQRAPMRADPAADARQQLAASAPADAAPSRPSPSQAASAQPGPAPETPAPTPLDAAGPVAATALAAAAPRATRRAPARRVAPPRARAAAQAVPAQALARTEVPSPAAAPPQATTPAPQGDAGLRAVAVADMPQPASAAATPATVDELFLGEAVAPSRPWPRAILPGLSGDAFTVDYGGSAQDDGGFDYFEPRLPAEPPPPR